MAKKSRPIHTCSACGYVSPKWLGRCPDCGSWGTMEEKVAGASVSGGHASLVPTSPVQPITHVGAQTAKTVRTGIGELDRVLGSGIVPGSVVLMAGEPGVGKSTLLLEVASRWAQLDRTVLYATAEESAGQVRARADRTGALHESLYLAAESNLDAVFGHVDAIKPGLIIVDSVQTMQAAGVEGVPGGVAQSRAVTAALTSLAKSTGIPVLLVGHVTKDGNVAVTLEV